MFTLLMGGAALGALTPWLLSTPRGTQFIAACSTFVLPGTVELDQLDVGWLSGKACLRGLKVYESKEEGARQLVAVEAVLVEASLLTLLLRFLAILAFGSKGLKDPPPKLTATGLVVDCTFSPELQEPRLVSYLRSAGLLGCIVAIWNSGGATTTPAASSAAHHSPFHATSIAAAAKAVKKAAKSTASTASTKARAAGSSAKAASHSAIAAAAAAMHGHTSHRSSGGASGHTAPTLTPSTSTSASAIAAAAAAMDTTGSGRITPALSTSVSTASALAAAAAAMDPAASGRIAPAGSTGGSSSAAIAAAAAAMSADASGSDAAAAAVSAPTTTSFIQWWGQRLCHSEPVPLELQMDARLPLARVCVQGGVLLVPKDIRDMVGYHVKVSVAMGLQQLEVVSAKLGADSDTSWAEEEPPTAGVMPTSLGDYHPDPVAPDHADHCSLGHDAPDQPGGSASGHPGRPAADRGPRPAFRRLEPVAAELRSDFLTAHASGWANFGMMILREPASWDISLHSSLAQYALSLANPFLNRVMEVGHTKLQVTFIPAAMELPCSGGTIQVAPTELLLLHQSAALQQLLEGLRLGGLAHGSADGQIMSCWLSQQTWRVEEWSTVHIQRQDMFICAGGFQMHMALWGRCNLRTTQLELQVGVLEAALAADPVYKNFATFVWGCKQQREDFKFQFPVEGSPDRVDVHLGRLGSHLVAHLAAQAVKGVGTSLLNRLRDRLSGPPGGA